MNSSKELCLRQAKQWNVDLECGGLNEQDYQESIDRRGFWINRALSYIPAVNRPKDW
jgi:hypothetical protein